MAQPKLMTPVRVVDIAAEALETVWEVAGRDIPDAEMAELVGFEFTEQLYRLTAARGERGKYFTLKRGHGEPVALEGLQP